MVSAPCSRAKMKRHKLIHLTSVLKTVISLKEPQMLDLSTALSRLKIKQLEEQRQEALRVDTDIFKLKTSNSLNSWI